MSIVNRLSQPMKRFALCLMIPVASAVAFAQSQTCYPIEEIERYRAVALAELADFQTRVKEYSTAAGELQKALKLVADCQGERSVLGDIVETLTLGNAECRNEILRGQFAKERVDSLKQFVETKESILKVLTDNYKQAVALRCRQ